MSKQIVENDWINSISQRFVESPFRPNSPVLILASYEPHSIISASILCRAAFRANLVFHVKFCNPVIQEKQLIDIRKENKSHTIILIGVAVLGRSDLENTLIISSNREESELLSLQAYGFALQKLEVSDSEFELAIIGMHAEQMDTSKISTNTKNLLNLAEESGIVRRKKRFRILGSNYMPIIDALVGCIHPYLDGLSGMERACEKLLEEADIPLLKRSGTIEELSIDETKRLSEQLVTHLPSNTIPQIIGDDLELLSEAPRSPLRYYSGLSALLKTSWSKKSFGLALGVLLGDHGRILKRLQNIYDEHSSTVLHSLQETIVYLNKSDITVERKDDTLIAPAEERFKPSLPDIGRILLETSFGDAKSIVFAQDDFVSISWFSNNKKLSEVLTQYYAADYIPIATSPKSIFVSIEQESEIAKIHQIMESIGVDS